MIPADSLFSKQWAEPWDHKTVFFPHGLSRAEVKEEPMGLLRRLLLLLLLATTCVPGKSSAVAPGVS